MPKRVNDPIDLALGQRLAELREYRSMTQLQLANSLGGLSVGAVQHMEHGRSHITSERLSQIAKVLRVEFTDLTQPPGSPMSRFFCHNAAQLQAAVDLLGLARYSWNPQTNALTWDARLKAIWGLPPDIEPDYEI
jgi:transcriptional regulator with XRE-family HTH domain